MKLFKHSSFFITSVLVVAAVLGLSRAYTEASDAPVITPVFPSAGADVYENQWGSNFSVMWGGATTCEYSYDGESYTPTDCEQNNVTPPVAEGPTDLYFRGTNDGGTSNASVSFTYHLSPRFTVTYSAGSHVTITGTTVQSVIQGGNSETVTAVPDLGYHFDGWSDGLKTAYRQEINVQNDITVTASAATGGSYITTGDAFSDSRAIVYIPYTVYYDGTPAYPVQAEFQYSTDTAFDGSTTVELSVAQGNGGHSSVVEIKNLRCGQTYNYRPIVMDSVGNKSYGIEGQFTTADCRLPTLAVESFSNTGDGVDIGVNLLDSGTDPVIKMTLVYHQVGDSNETTQEINGNPSVNVGIQTFQVRGLQCGKQYFFTVSAENPYGTTTLDPVDYTISCSSNLHNNRPTVVTEDATDVGSTTATLVGTITNIGDDPSATAIIARGFIYVKASLLGEGEPAEEDVNNIIETGEFGAGTYTAVVTSLECETEYVYVTIAQNNVEGADLTHGGETLKFFTTGACQTDTPSGGGGGQQTGGGIVSNLTLFTPTVFNNTMQNEYAGCTGSATFSPVSGKKCPSSVVGEAIYEFTKFLSFGSYDEQVRQLQRFLNSHGFPVAATGPGSKGFEIPIFGSRTLRALSLYQRMNNITPASGIFGPKTLQSINEMLRKEGYIKTQH